MDSPKNNVFEMMDSPNNVFEVKDNPNKQRVCSDGQS